MKLKIDKSYYIIFLISFSIFFIKWFFSYYNYGFEDIIIKVIFNPAGDQLYYPFVKQLSDLNFNEGYSKIYNDLNLIGFPFFTSLIHAIFFKIFGPTSFIILELILIIVVNIIFFKIFKLLKLSNNYSIIFAFVLFSLPNFIYLLNELKIPYIFNLKQLYSGFYSLRFPRPIITNLFLFLFLFFSIKFYISEFKKDISRNLYFSTIFLASLLSSFFYFFLSCGISLVLIIFIKYKNSILSKENLFLFLKCGIIFCIISTPFILQLLFIEKDYLYRIGYFKLNYETKIFLFGHLFKGFTKLEFLCLLFLNTFLFFLNVKLNNNIRKYLLPFFIFFISSIIVPFIFLTFFSGITFFNYFIFTIILSGFIFLKINIIILFSYFVKPYSKKIVSVLIFFLIIFFNGIYFYKNSFINQLSSGTHFNAKNPDTFRKDFQNLTNLLKKKVNNDNALLLTNDLETQLWWILSGKKYYYFPVVLFVSLKDHMIEEQLINAFKYLDLTSSDFINYFNQNRISSWRVVNTNNYFFLGHLKYQANYLKKFADIDYYPKNTHKFIKKKSIHHTNQVVLPFNEILRLKKQFNQTKKNKYLKPNIIVLNKSDFLYKKILQNNKFEILMENENFILFKFS